MKSKVYCNKQLVAVGTSALVHVADSVTMAYVLPCRFHVGFRQSSNQLKLYRRVAACAHQPPDSAGSENVADLGAKAAAAKPPLSRSRPRPPLKEYSMRARLREETEAPFRKVRQFVFIGSAMSAAVGSFISSLRIVAAISGIRGVQPLSETSSNLAINLGVIGVCAYLWKRDQDAGVRRLERMTRGARIAKLKVTDFNTGKVTQLSEYRFQYRIVVIAGPLESVASSLKEARAWHERLTELNVKIVPLVVHSSTSTTTAYAPQYELERGSWVADPFDYNSWVNWLRIEKELSSNSAVLGAEDISVFIIRLDGKLGARSIGAPFWNRLVDEVSMLPKSDRFGKP